jgi:hypothetical protein
MDEILSVGTLARGGGVVKACALRYRPRNVWRYARGEVRNRPANCARIVVGES